MTPIDERLAAALYACAGVVGVYRLASSRQRYSKFERIDPFRWAVLLSPMSPAALVLAESAALRALGRERMRWITFLDGDVQTRGPLLRHAERIPERADTHVVGEPPPIASEERILAYGTSCDVLVVADAWRFLNDASYRLPARPWLKRHDAPGYRRALEMLGSEAFDMVLVDGGMVGMHAAAVCEWIAIQRPALFPRIRVVMAGAPDSVISRIAAMRVPTLPTLDVEQLAIVVGDLAKR